MRIETHRLGIDGHDRTEIEVLGQVVPVQNEVVPFGMNCVMLMIRSWCPGEDSNFHDLTVTDT